eukprot:scaffold87881_cov38-Attheya_sp.AAC.1
MKNRFSATISCLDFGFARTMAPPFLVINVPGNGPPERIIRAPVMEQSLNMASSGGSDMGTEASWGPQQASLYKQSSLI